MRILVCKLFFIKKTYHSPFKIKIITVNIYFLTSRSYYINANDKRNLELLLLHKQ